MEKYTSYAEKRKASMAKEYPLRFYANPWKLGLYILGSGVFVAAGLLIIQSGSQEVWAGAHGGC